jgi:hypothetical protein
VAPVVAVGPDCNPVVAWIEQATSGGIQQLYLKRWTGTAWEELGGSASGSGVSQSPGGNIGAADPSVAVDSQGQIYAAWKFAATPGGTCCTLSIYVRRWNGTAWEELGGSASGAGLSGGPGSDDGSAPVIRIDNVDQPVVVWNAEGQAVPCAVLLKRWNGVVWEELGGSATGSGVETSGGANGDPSLAIDHNGNPVVAWGSARTLGFSVRQWTTTEWSDVGPQGSTGSCEAGGGVPVAVDAAGRPVVAASDPFTDPSIHVQQWSGTSWIELPPSGAVSPAALASNGLIVIAWSSSAEIYVAQWDGTAWQALGSGVAGTTHAFNPDIAMP